MAKQSEQVSAADFLPPAVREGRASLAGRPGGKTDRRVALEQMTEAVQGCRGCELYEGATQAVFGEGPVEARVVFVGEQPGDKEDASGHPFVGPAGRVLDRAMEEAGIDRRLAYVTNAVKHFRFEHRGRSRIHAKPSSRHVRACLPWLEHEIGAIRPGLVVCLGATAARALLGAAFRVTKQRGEPIRGTRWAPVVVATIHPSAVLRMPDDEARKAAYLGLVDDLRTAREALEAE